MTSAPRAAAYIDLGVLEENFRLIKSLVTPGTRILCVVKADAYGHGAGQAARRLEFAGADYLGVASVDEGLELRSQGISLPILIMSGILPWERVDRLTAAGLTPAVYDFEGLKRVAEAGRAASRPIRIHVKIDTGMGRLGFLPAEVPRVAAWLREMPRVEVEGLMSHFASSEVRDDFGLKQIETFRESARILRESGIAPEILHMGNSGAILTYPEGHFHMIRAGISLYGSHPDRRFADRLPVRQVMRYVSRVGLIRDLPPGYSLSYGRTFTTRGPTRVAYVPSGYADGFPRALSNRGSVLIKDRRCSIVGRVCMDWLMADITGHDDIGPGDEVILLGRGERDMISADEIAELAGTIPYEVLCKISKRVDRIYVG